MFTKYNDIHTINKEIKKQKTQIKKLTEDFHYRIEKLKKVRKECTDKLHPILKRKTDWDIPFKIEFHHEGLTIEGLFEEKNIHIVQPTINFYIILGEQPKIKITNTILPTYTQEYGDEVVIEEKMRGMLLMSTLMGELADDILKKSVFYNNLIKQYKRFYKYFFKRKQAQHFLNDAENKLKKLKNDRKAFIYYDVIKKGDKFVNKDYVNYTNAKSNNDFYDRVHIIIVKELEENKSRIFFVTDTLHKHKEMSLDKLIEILVRRNFQPVDKKKQRALKLKTIKNS